jgi:hypothetical protein
VQHTSLSIDKIYVVTCACVERERGEREKEKAFVSECLLFGLDNTLSFLM